MFDMVETHVVQFGYMVIVYAVENLPARFSSTHKPHLPQSAQLMRDSRLCHFESLRQSAYAHLAFDEQGNNPHAACVAEGAKEFGKLDGFEFGEFHVLTIEYMNKYSYIILKKKIRQYLFKNYTFRNGMYKKITNAPVNPSERRGVWWFDWQDRQSGSGWGFQTWLLFYYIYSLGNRYNVSRN